MNQLISAICLFFFLTGCATLTKTQVGAVQQFAQTSKDFSEFPSGILSELSEVRKVRGAYYANSVNDPEIHLKELDNVYLEHKEDFALTEKADITFKVIDAYAQSLLLLSSDKYSADLKKQSQNIGVDLDSLVAAYNAKIPGPKCPAGIGACLGQLMVFGGKQYLKARQAKEIRKFVLKADTLIGLMSANLLDFLKSGSIKILIDNEEAGLREGFKFYLTKRMPVPVESEKEYLQLKDRLEAIRTLQKQTISATRSLRKAHGRLVLELVRKRKIKEKINELQDLYADMKDLRSTVAKIKKYK